MLLGTSIHYEINSFVTKYYSHRDKTLELIEFEEQNPERTEAELADLKIKKKIYEDIDDRDMTRLAIEKLLTAERLRFVVSEY